MNAPRRLFEVTVLLPISLRVRASTEEDATKAALAVRFASLSGAAVESAAQGFPESISIKELEDE